MYKLTKSTGIIRLSDNAFIPADPANTDYQAFNQWLSEGNTPEPAATDIPEPAPMLDPVEKLRQFLAANPDVQEVLK